MTCIDIGDHFSHSHWAEIMRYYKSSQIKLNKRVKPGALGENLLEQGREPV